MDQSIELRSKASFCHWCNQQLQIKAIDKRPPGQENNPDQFYFYKVLRTPHDGYPVRVHMACEENALKEGYTRDRPSNP